MPSPDARDGVVVILGTGGTIAGAAADPADDVGYTAAQRAVRSLVDAVPSLAAQRLECEQLAQLDSKDMDHATWQRLALRAAHHLARDDAAGVVATHGTDTLEETATFLHLVLAPRKPLVLVAAMRPATSLQADGPQNLLDAVRVARHPDARGVLAVLAGQVHAGDDVRKWHPYRLDAFGSGDAGPLALIEDGALRVLRPWPRAVAVCPAALQLPVDRWPRVEIVTSHAGSDGRVVRSMVRDGVDGLVVAATGNGSIHRELEAALDEAARAGVRVWRATRCGAGAIVGGRADWPGAGALTPAKARVALLLELLAARRPA